MASRLKQILSFANLVVGVPSTTAHGLNWNGRPVKPDIAQLTEAGFTVSATDTSLTITRGSGPADVDVLIESWHTIERAFGAKQILHLSPQPIVVQGSSGAGDFLGAIDTGGYKTTTGVLTIPARDILLVQVSVHSYGLPGIVGLRFNGDTGNNYYTRYLVSPAGGTTLTNVEEPSTDLLRVAGLDTTHGRAVLIAVNNKLNAEKIATVSTFTGTDAAATAPDLMWGGGSWVNRSAQITSIEMVEDGGQFFDAGFAVWGHDLPVPSP